MRIAGLFIVATQSRPLHSRPPPQNDNSEVVFRNQKRASERELSHRERPVGTGSSQSQHPEHARHTMNSTEFVIASAADKIMPKVAGPRAVPLSLCACVTSRGIRIV